MNRLLNHKMKAVLVTKTSCEIVSRPIPVPEANEVLIKGKRGSSQARLVADGPARTEVGLLAAANGLRSRSL